ncbi:MAG: winged helix-turn-helix transcriptional regulator, partial [Thermoanaerobaculia bacterium]|nr:winged helix-turn-helix transcriptional regulator [Thermoanaerobaculia bacterium]
MNHATLASNPLVADLAALADPVRLRLLALLEREELGVGELAAVVQLPQPTVSRHLKALAAQGWVVSRTERTSNRYRFAAGELGAGASTLWDVARRETDGWPALAQYRLPLPRLL